MYVYSPTAAARPSASLASALPSGSASGSSLEKPSAAGLAWLAGAA
jgi:hypothetical protein